MQTFPPNCCRWAAAQLSENGEDLVGRIRLPQYLLLARTLLLAPLAVRQAEGMPAGTVATVTPPTWLPTRLPSWAWWALRAVLLQQRLLSGLSAGLRSLLLGLVQLVLDAFATPVEAALQQLGTGASSGGSSGDSSASPPSLEDQLLAAGALLEAALLETAYGHVEPAKALLQRSGDVLGFRPGAWGVGGPPLLWDGMDAVATGRCGIMQRAGVASMPGVGEPPDMPRVEPRQPALSLSLQLTRQVPLPPCFPCHCRADRGHGCAHGAPAGSQGAAAGGSWAPARQPVDRSAGGGSTA